MFDHLQIYEPRERWVVGAVDGVLGIAARFRPRHRPPTDPPRRILLLRLERLGDLLMTLDALHVLRQRAPSAEMHLVVGSWNAPVAQAIGGLDRVEYLDAPWLARGRPADSPWRMVRRALGWRARRYDLAINFEGDLRSNLLLALSGAGRTIGFGMAGGGPLLTDALEHRARLHTSANTMRLVDHAFEAGTHDQGSTDQAGQRPRLAIPTQARRAAAQLLEVGLASSPAGSDRGSTPPPAHGTRSPVLVGIHPSGGRAIKQWDPRRFAQLANRLASEQHATIVLTGTADDRALADSVRAGIVPGVPVIDLVGRLDLMALGGLLERLAVFVTADTGPMHLADELGTPVVAIFGPSLPTRYGPRSRDARIVRVDLPCSPCNRIRRPPARCVGHLPDCLASVDVEVVHQAVVELLSKTSLRVTSESPGRRAN